MLTVTHNSYQEKLSVGDEDIILTGPPKELRFVNSADGSLGCIFAAGAARLAQRR